MKHRRTVLVMTLLVIPLLTMCRSATPALDYQMRASNAEARLESLMKQLPAPPGAVLVKRVNNSTGGNMPECAGRQIEALFGTNDLSYREVLDFYTTSLQASGWHLLSADDKGRSFDMGDEFNADVSDLYNVSFVGRDAVQEGKSKFRTIYLLGLYTYIVLPVPSQCKGG